MKRLVCLVALAGMLGACAKSSEPLAAPAYAAPGLSLDEYERMLAQHEVALRRQGVRVPPSGTTLALADGTRRDANTPDREPAAGAGSDLDAGRTVGGASGAPAPAQVDERIAQEAAPRPADSPDAGDDPEMGPRSVARGASVEKRNTREPVDERCEMICELAAATCDLETKICELAREHQGDPRYDNACLRAGRDCEIAQEACVECAQ